MNIVRIRQQYGVFKNYQKCPLNGLYLELLPAEYRGLKLPAASFINPEPGYLTAISCFYLAYSYGFVNFACA